jgi:hypothetical protein
LSTTTINLHPTALPVHCKPFLVSVVWSGKSDQILSLGRRETKKKPLDFLERKSVETRIFFGYKIFIMTWSLVLKKLNSLEDVVHVYIQ